MNNDAPIGWLSSCYNDQPPKGWLWIYNRRTLKKADYPELFKSVGNCYGNETELTFTVGPVRANKWDRHAIIRAK